MEPLLKLVQLGISKLIPVLQIRYKAGDSVQDAPAWNEDWNYTIATDHTRMHLDNVLQPKISKCFTKH